MHIRHLRVVLHSIVVVLTSAVLSILGNNLSVARGESDLNITPPTAPIKKDLFGLHVINLEYGVIWPTVSFSGWRNFNSYWAKIEPDRGRWNFTRLDNDIRVARQKSVDVMLVLGSTPTWASARPWEPGCCTDKAPKGNAAEALNIEDWRTYVRTVATRYKGQVSVYELWNEPNVKRFYTGSEASLVQLAKAAYEEIKTVDPSTVVVSSSLSPCCDSLSFMSKYFSLGGYKYSDVVGYHFYAAPRPPEAMLSRIQEVQALMQQNGVNKPLWNTETGWRIINHDQNDAGEVWAGAPLLDDQAAAYIVRSFILSWAGGVERLYWYAWGHKGMGMTEYDGRTPKSIANAFAETQEWLIGSQMTSCASRDKVWICTLKRKDGRLVWIIWGTGETKEFTVPDNWHAYRYKTLGQGTYQVLRTNTMSVGAMPALLEQGP